MDDLDKRKKAFFAALRASVSRPHAAAKAGIAYGMVKKWLELGENGHPEHEEFWREALLAEAEAVTGPMDVITQAANDGSTIAAMWLLQHRFGYVASKVNLGNANGEPLEASVKIFLPKSGREVVASTRESEEDENGEQ